MEHSGFHRWSDDDDDGDINNNYWYLENSSNLSRTTLNSLHRSSYLILKPSLWGRDDYYLFFFKMRKLRGSRLNYLPMFHSKKKKKSLCWAWAWKRPILDAVCAPITTESLAGKRGGLGFYFQGLHCQCSNTLFDIIAYCYLARSPWQYFPRLLWDLR